jgi:hypothetical protein
MRTTWSAVHHSRCPVRCIDRTEEVHSRNLAETQRRLSCERSRTAPLAAAVVRAA